MKHGSTSGSRRVIRAVAAAGLTLSLALGVPATVATAAPDRGPHKSTPGGNNNDNHVRHGAEPDRSPHKFSPGHVSNAPNAQTNHGRADFRQTPQAVPKARPSSPATAPPTPATPPRPPASAPQSARPTTPPAQPASPVAPAVPPTAPSPATAATDPWSGLPKLPPPTATTSPADDSVLPGDLLRSTSTGQANPRPDRSYRYPLTDGSYGHFEQRSTTMGTDRVLSPGYGPFAVVSVPEGTPGAASSINIDSGSGSYGVGGSPDNPDTISAGASTNYDIRVVRAVPTRTSTVVVDGVKRPLVHYTYQYQLRKNTLAAGDPPIGVHRMTSDWRDATPAETSQIYRSAAPNGTSMNGELPQLK